MDAYRITHSSTYTSVAVLVMTYDFVIEKKNVITTIHGVTIGASYIIHLSLLFTLKK